MSTDGRLSLSFVPDPGADVQAIVERLRRVASDLPVGEVEIGPAEDPGAVYSGKVCPMCGKGQLRIRKPKSTSGGLFVRRRFYCNNPECGYRPKRTQTVDAKETRARVRKN